MDHIFEGKHNISTRSSGKEISCIFRGVPFSCILCGIIAPNKHRSHGYQNGAWGAEHYCAGLCER